jgi:sugar phosphate isomerase/epimerase
LFTCPDIFNYKTIVEKDVPLIDDWSFTEIGKLLPLARNAHLKICEVIERNTTDRYLDVKRVFAQLNKAGYNGPLALEFMWPYLKSDKNELAELEKAMQVLSCCCNGADG